MYLGENRKQTSLAVMNVTISFLQKNTLTQYNYHSIFSYLLYPIWHKLIWFTFVIKEISQTINKLFSPLLVVIDGAVWSTWMVSVELTSTVIVTLKDFPSDFCLYRTASCLFGNHVHMGFYIKIVFCTNLIIFRVIL